ncbi:MAG: hypothetical protein ACOYUK_04235 [Patescibacteria group bacterium]
MNMSKKFILIGITVVVLGVIGYFGFSFFSKVNELNSNQSVSTTNINATVNATVGLDNQNVNAAANTNSAEPAGNFNTNEPITSTGVVFIKGYKTPSESYGILSNEGFEIGFGKYDSMREQFRPYVGDQVEVTFSSVCRTSAEGCCRTLFTFCGTVDSFTPIEE